MSFPSNERLLSLYQSVAEQLTEEQVEVLLRRAGHDPTGQEIKDVQHRVTEIIRGYVKEHRTDT